MFDLKKSKGQIDQWEVMDFLNAYTRNLHLPWTFQQSHSKRYPHPVSLNA